MIGLMILLCLAASAELTPGATVWLGRGQRVGSADGRLAVTFLEVLEDSRCPEGAQCIWAGNARVRLRLADRDGEREAEINSTLDPREVPLGGLVLRFADLLPHPRLGEEIDPDTYRLALEVLERTESSAVSTR